MKKVLSVLKREYKQVFQRVRK